jgi:hypothetical protein
MKASGRVLVMMGLLAGAVELTASGPLGIYGIVERVVVEPNETTPQRIQVWGAFAYVDGAAGQSLTVSAAKRGYLYFRLPTGADGVADRSQVEVINNEWADLKAVAGTGQAIGFGQWGYVGAFPGLQPDTRSNMPPYILERAQVNQQTDLRVRPASEAPSSPALYQTNAGIVRLQERGSHAEIVKRLQEALKR